MEELKTQMQALMRRRDEMEAEIAQIGERLNAGAGIKGSLVDAEGFPRADVDVHAVRNDRHRLALLTNDHKALTQQIEPLMYALHAAAREAREAQQASSAAPAQPPAAPAAPPVAAAAAPAAPVPLPRPQQPAQQPLRPFAVVDEVAGEDAPAARAGVQLGDQLCTFGEASGASGAPVAALMQQVASELASHEGRQVTAVVLRHGSPVTLQLVPQRWSGRGLLGCHLRPLGG